MATTLLISKADFMAANLVRFSPNIGADQLEPHVYAAQEYDLEPRLGADLYGAVLTYAANPDGSKPQLLAFTEGVLRRYLVLVSYKRFLASHGLNITQFGFTKTADPQGTFSQAEATERAVILRQIDADANVALGKLLSTPWTFDGIAYAKDRKASLPSQTIRAPRRFRDSIEKRVAAAGSFGFTDLID